jgi:hypothetical protein
MYGCEEKLIEAKILAVVMDFNYLVAQVAAQ